MIRRLLEKKKDITFDRTYPHPVTTVWKAWTQPEMLRQWWGPDKTTVPECEVDLRVGGELYIVMEAGEGMGKYQGTRWPMRGTFTAVDEHVRLTYDARSWTEGEEEGTTIHHVNDIAFTEVDGATRLQLRVAINAIGPRAKMAAFGMKWGYKAQLDKLDQLLGS